MHRPNLWRSQDGSAHRPGWHQPTRSPEALSTGPIASSAVGCQCRSPWTPTVVCMTSSCHIPDLSCWRSRCFQTCGLRLEGLRRGRKPEAVARHLSSSTRAAPAGEQRVRGLAQDPYATARSPTHSPALRRALVTRRREFPCRASPRATGLGHAARDFDRHCLQRTEEQPRRGPANGRRSYRYG